MPLTPFHLGPGLLIGLLLLSYIDFTTFLVASVIADVEPIIVIIFDLDYPLHGFFHSLLGGTIVAFLLAAVMSKARESLSPLLSFFKLEQKSTFKNILLASLTGIYIHILLDSRIHRDIRPFYPMDFNPFLSSSTLDGWDVHVLCVWCFVGAAAIYLIRLFLIWRRTTK
ncbi:MAG: hypothetical protein OEW62_01745 [Candidatus Bathyarchaeota archaeon]|nr:hypothetical protein [Candidatus Bathyarchaeota archaeon]MDH5595236.1 hypothetical protein [Candidatus Bathyarchaeota archaeon]